MDTRALAGAEATGVGRYIRALLESFHAREDVEVHRYPRQFPPLVGPQLIAPLQMRAGHADVIHGPANALPLLPVGVPGVVTVHDLAIYDHPEWFPNGQWLATRVIVPRSIRGAAAIVCPSEATRHAVERIFAVKPDRCHVIPHGVEPIFFDPVSEAHRQQVSERYRLPDRYLLQVGTIQPRKNYLTTLRALARIPPAERLPLLAVGNFGWDFHPVLEAVSSLKLSSWVRFAGYAGLDDLPALYQMAEVAVFPSLDEGFGIPVLEAFAAGVPLVASTAGAIPEVAGDAALLCDPMDDTALANNLQRLIGDRAFREQRVARGREQARQYSWSASGQAHRAVYESVIRR